VLNVWGHRSYKDYNDEYRSRRNVLPYLPRYRLGDGRNLCPWVSLHALRRVGPGIRLDSWIHGGKRAWFTLSLLYRFSEELRVLTNGIRAFTAFGRDVTVLVALLTAELLVSFWAKPSMAISIALVPPACLSASRIATSNSSGCCANSLLISKPSLISQGHCGSNEFSHSLS